MDIVLNNNESLKLIKKYKTLIYLNSIANYESILGPILIIFYLNFMGLTFSQYVFLDGLLCLLLTVFEVPSGYLADLFGRKKTLILSLSMVCLSMVILLSVKSFEGALIAIIIQGLFAPLGSGNVEAIYFETFKGCNREDELESIYSKQNAIMFVALTVMSVISGFLATINLAYPMIISILLLIFNIICYCILLKDNKLYVNKDKKNNIPTIRIIKNSINDLKNVRNTTTIFILSAVFFCSTRVAYTFYQPLFEAVKIDVKYFGIIFAGFNMIGFLVSLIAPKVFKVLKTENKVFFVLSMLIIVSFWGIISTKNTIVLLIFIILQQVVRALHFPYFKLRNNYYIPPNSEYRVTYLSYSNLINTLTLTILLAAFSMLNSRLSLITSIKYLGIILTVIILFSAFVHSLLKKRGEVICYQSQE